MQRTKRNQFAKGSVSAHRERERESILFGCNQRSSTWSVRATQRWSSFQHLIGPLIFCEETIGSKRRWRVVEVAVADWCVVESSSISAFYLSFVVHWNTKSSSAPTVASITGVVGRGWSCHQRLVYVSDSDSCVAPPRPRHVYHTFVLFWESEVDSVGVFSSVGSAVGNGLSRRVDCDTKCQVQKSNVL